MQNDNYINATTEYLKKHIEDDSIICYIAIDNNKIIASVIVSVYTVIPKPSNPSGKIGYVFNVNTNKEYQKQGIVTKLMKNVIQTAKENGVGELFLNTTDEGQPIYEKLNFQHIEKEMRLKII